MSKVKIISVFSLFLILPGIYGGEVQKEAIGKLVSLVAGSKKEDTEKHSERNTDRKMGNPRNEELAHPQVPAENILSANDISELSQIAKKLGCSEASLKNMKPSDMIKEIRTRLSSSEKCYNGKMLSDKDNKDLEDWLSDAPRLLNIVQIYDRVIKDLAGKRMVVLPRKKDTNE